MEKTSFYLGAIKRKNNYRMVEIRSSSLFFGFSNFLEICLGIFLTLGNFWKNIQYFFYESHRYLDFRSVYRLFFNFFRGPSPPPPRMAGGGMHAQRYFCGLFRNNRPFHKLASPQKIRFLKSLFKKIQFTINFGKKLHPTLGP